MKYRIKEECKKYFTPVTSESEQTIDEWYSQGIHDEALEEVESKIEVKITVFQMGRDMNYYPYYLSKLGNLHWTEKERELVEFCLNEFKSLKDLDNIITDYACYFSEKDGFANLFNWLKDRK